ncbi:MAG: glutathione S-transferase family protein [Alphaproteobacteria bacterium]|nr:glutathione S-transferase family protein [Alphaproteobacteria bacterium]MBU0797448.1 glutathione S-transferase family protein [Alphaproteobacteria bacterium]MBU0888567.1 glutathione S-transferase family protein [Alphaproteobacteria bacterium]MBU1813699.1 glutathione S-transferase family protein [Alphaproteobacteria bacterium]
MLRLYDYLDSGNGYKARLLLSKLGLAYELVELDILRGESRTPDFLAKNPNGRIPALALEDGTVIAESGAILYYLAEGTRYWPEDRLARAQVLHWMFFEQYSHEPFIAVLRFWYRHGPMDEKRRALEPEKRKGGEAALAVMERHLAGRSFFVGETLTIADIALYAYTHAAEDGGFELSRYPAIQAWLARVAADPGHVAMLPEGYVAEKA